MFLMHHFIQLMMHGVWIKGTCQINNWITAHGMGQTLLGLRDITWTGTAYQLVTSFCPGWALGQVESTSWYI